MSMNLQLSCFRDKKFRKKELKTSNYGNRFRVEMKCEEKLDRNNEKTIPTTYK